MDQQEEPHCRLHLCLSHSADLHLLPPFPISFHLQRFLIPARSETHQVTTRDVGGIETAGTPHQGAHLELESPVGHLGASCPALEWLFHLQTHSLPPPDCWERGNRASPLPARCLHKAWNFCELIKSPTSAWGFLLPVQPLSSSGQQ